MQLILVLTTMRTFLTWLVGDLSFFPPIVQATLKADPKTYDPYSTFKAFEKYPKVSCYKKH